MFGHLNKTNVAMQGKIENLLSSTDKIKALSEKLRVWKQRVAGGIFETFPYFCQDTYDYLIPSILDHSKELETRIKEYFPSISSDMYEWVRNPFFHRTVRTQWI